MTITSNILRRDYTANGVNTSYAFDFPIFYESNATPKFSLEVIVADTTGAETTKIETTDYTITYNTTDYVNGVINQGNVVFNTAPANNYTISLLRKVNFTQNNDITTSGSDALPGTALEGSLDKLTLMLLEQKENLNRVFKLPKSSSLSNIEFPIGASQANQVITVNNAGDNLTTKDLADVGLAPVSTFAKTLLDDTTASQARTTLDAQQVNANLTFIANLPSAKATTTNQGVAYLTPNKNVIINGNFNINQRVVSGTVSLSSGVYGHDRWKAGASGCTYTFATTNNITTITISAGSLIQVVEGNNLVSDTYSLSWSGTAQGKIGAGSYGASGTTGSATGGTNLNIEFGTGTLSLVQLEKNLAPTPFEHRFFADELRLCQRYYEKTYNQSAVAGALTFIGSRAFSSQNGQQNLCPVYFKVTKRANPTITLFSPITGVAGKISTGVIDIDGTPYNPAEDGFYVGPTTTTTLTNLFFQYSAISEL